MLPYQQKIQYIKKKCMEYNVDSDRNHLNVARDFAEAHEMPMNLIMSETDSQVMAFTVGQNTYQVKGVPNEGCLLGKTPKMCHTEPQNCYTCGWFKSCADARISRIRAGQMIGNPKHLIVIKRKGVESA